VLASPCNYAALAEIYEQVLQQQLPRPPTTLDVDRMIAQLQQALDRGALSAWRVEPAAGPGGLPSQRERPRPRPAPQQPPPPRAVPRSAEEDEPETWFEVLVLDEVAQPVGGVELAFTLHGTHRTAFTGDDGKARVEGVKERSGAVAFADVPALRETMIARWNEVREGEPPPDGENTTRLYLQRQLPAVSVLCETPATIVIAPKIVRVRLIGMHFETAKCFLLPTAMKGIKKVKTVYDAHDDATLLAVGHTDTAGPDWYNEPLSLERASSVSAYLSDDVGAWLKWYDSSDADKRWGTREDQYMLSAVPWGEVAFYRGTPTGARDAQTQAALAAFQQSKGLPATGKADRATRQALIADYMALDGTSLPAGDEVVTHGCGPYFTDVATGPGVALEANRRVEIFVFDGPVQPPPPGKISKRGTLQYPTWRARTVETVDFTAGADGDSEIFRIRLHDDEARPLTAVAYWLRVPGQEPVESVSDDGWVEIGYPTGMCFESIELAWARAPDGSYRFRRDFILECSVGSEQEQATAKLHNVGFSSTLPYEDAVRAFQSRYALGETGLQGGALPPKTKAKLWGLYDGDCDATPPGGR